MPAPSSEGERVRLRALEPSDIEARRALGIVPEIVRAFGGDTPSPDATLSEQALAAWFERESAERYSWVIEFEGRFIGTVRLHSLDERGIVALAIGPFFHTWPRREVCSQYFVALESGIDRQHALQAAHE